MKSSVTLMLVLIALCQLALTSCSHSSKPKQAATTNDTVYTYCDWDAIKGREHSDDGLYIDPCRQAGCLPVIYVACAQKDDEGDGHIFIRGNRDPRQVMQ